MREKKYVGTEKERKRQAQAEYQKRLGEKQPSINKGANYGAARKAKKARGCCKAHT